MSKSKVQRKKTVRAQPPHKCSCCGKVGHNIKQCPSPAAKELLHLRAAVKGFLEGAPQKRFKGRLPVKTDTKSEGYRKEAKEAYGSTKNTVGTRNPHHQSSSSVVDGCCAEDVEALKELVSFGFTRGFDKGRSWGYVPPLGYPPRPILCHWRAYFYCIRKLKCYKEVL